MSVGDGVDVIMKPNQMWNTFGTLPQYTRTMRISTGKKTSDSSH